MQKNVHYHFSVHLLMDNTKTKILNKMLAMLLFTTKTTKCESLLQKLIIIQSFDRLN